MIVDRQTHLDLEVFEGRDGRPSLFRMLDCAKTRGGANALRRRIAAPLSRAQNILAVQASIRFILAHVDVFDMLPSQFAASGFENYFHHRVGPPAAGKRASLLIDGLILRVDNPRDFSRIELGVEQALHILSWFQSACSLLRDDEDQGEVGVLLRAAQQLVSTPQLHALATRTFGFEFWRTLRRDQIIRGHEKQSFETLIDLLFEIDALVSLAMATRKYGFVLPNLTEGPPMLEGIGLFHPFLAHPVRNPIAIGPAQPLVFLTGPNMAGKTTYLRVCGITAYLAHIGMGVPAASLTFAPCDTLITGIALADDIRSGISFFQAEALRARAVAAALADGLRVFAILDEPFKGTNVKDAFDASCRFFSQLAGRDNSLFLISSHLIEAAPILQESGRVECLMFEASENGQALNFDYVLKNGISSQRLGMRVLEEHSVFELLDRPPRKSPPDFR